MTVTLAEIYTIATAIGSIYLTFSVLMGQLHLGGHSGGHGSHACSGHSHHAGAGDDGADFGDGDDGRLAFASLLSPMTISMFSAFFGITGLFVGKVFPFLGPFTLVPAIAAGVIVTALLMQAFSWLFAKSNVSTNARIDDLIGQAGEVCVPINQGRKGEITCVMGSKRYNYPAIAAKAAIAKGSRVIISDYKDGVVTVEPWEDAVLDISGPVAEPVVKQIEQ
jgi:membrane protein implicated in regulation of membrane protease activity